MSPPMTRGPRLRLAFVYDARYPEHQGGAERRIHELAIRLAARHEVHLVSWGSPMDAPRPELTNLVLDPVGRMPALYGADGRRTIREAAAFAVRLLPVLLRLRVDVINRTAKAFPGPSRRSRAARSPPGLSPVTSTA